MPVAHWYFKLFNSIKEESGSEVDLAELELQSLFGKVERVSNFANILGRTPFRDFMEGDMPVQDIMAHEIPYGRCQGFYAKTRDVGDVSLLIHRLAYIREFLVVAESGDWERLLKRMFPSGEQQRNVQVFPGKAYTLYRFITNEYFLEKSHYISKLSRNEKEVDRNVESLFAFLTKNLYRIPATVTMQVGKRLEDYFTVREEPSLYITHYMHPYKGRFHPKMVRALLNYIYPEEEGTAMDNFAGCGTTLVEATWMGLDSRGVDINPLSVLMSQVKCDALSIPPEKLKKTMESYLKELSSAFLSYEKTSGGSKLLFPPDYDTASFEKRRTAVPKKLTVLIPADVIDRVLIAHEIIKKIGDNKIRDFMLLGLSGAISDMARRRSNEFHVVLSERLYDLYLRIYIFHRLNQTLKIRLGSSVTHVGDTRDMKFQPDNSIDAIVNSPPYSTALDYIKNDYPQLALLELTDIPSLSENMIGNPSQKYYPDTLAGEVSKENAGYSNLPPEAKEVISELKKYSREKEGLHSYKFFKDMRMALQEMLRVMKPEAKCAIVIGNNHYKLDGRYMEVKNDVILMAIAKKLGFTQDRTITRQLEKSQAGMIRYESIVILSKPGRKR